MNTDNEICRSDAVTIASLVRSKKVSATEVAKAALRRMDVLEPHIHAFCTPTPEVALAAASVVDAKITAGEDPGRLAGVPIGIKDLVATKDILTVMGSPWYRDFVPDEDDSAWNGSRRQALSSLARPMFRSSATAASDTIQSFPRPAIPGISP